MRYFNRKFWLACATALLLSACSDSDDNTSNAGGALQQFSNNTGESKEIMDPDGLKQDLNSLFGVANSEPVAVNSGDSVQDVINNANAQ